MGFLESLDRLDREAFFALAGQGGPMADAVFAVISSTWAAVAVWFLLWAMRRRDVDMASWIWLLIAMLAAYALADWTSSALKELLARPRPCWEL
jgi:hypothetical protein